MSNLRFVGVNRITDVLNGVPQAHILNGPPVVYADGLNCISGNPEIDLTTPGFAYFTAQRVRRWSLLAATGIGARFPGSTRVLTVSDTQLVMNANASSSTPSDEAGTFTPAVAANEVAPYLIDNLLIDDRRVLWQGTGAVITVDVDLGANRPITIVGLHGNRPIGLGAAGIVSIVTKFATTATGYPPASGGAWTNANNGVLSGVTFNRDVVALLTAGGHNARYWRYDLEIVSSPFTLGKLLAGDISPDLGMVYSSASIEDSTPVAEERTYGRDPIVTIIGDKRRVLEIEYRSITSTTLAVLSLLAERNRSLILVDDNDVPREVIVRGSSLRYVHRFTNLYDAKLVLEQLG
jgi:hypothetical protein